MIRPRASLPSSVPALERAFARLGRTDRPLLASRISAMKTAGVGPLAHQILTAAWCAAFLAARSWAARPLYLGVTLFCAQRFPSRLSEQ